MFLLSFKRILERRYIFKNFQKPLTVLDLTLMDISIAQFPYVIRFKFLMSQVLLSK